MVKVGRRILTSLYLDPAQHAAIKALSVATRIPIAAYLREAVDDLLLKHEDVGGGYVVVRKKKAKAAKAKR